MTPPSDNHDNPHGDAPALSLPTSLSDLIAAIPDQDKTPLVLALLAIIDQQAKRIAELEAEVARLGGQPKKPASNSKPSALSKPPRPQPDPSGKRPGSLKRSKTQELTIHQEVDVPPTDLPLGSKMVRRDSFIVQDLVIEARNTRYWLETWQTPDGNLRRGKVPAGVRGHFGPDLVTFVLQQHYGAHVTQNRILEELRDFGVDISTGQVNNIVTEDHDAFHAEKDALLPAALQVSTVIGVDDTGARHQGRYGSCLCISNEFFTSFHSSDTKQRSKILSVLRCGHTDYVLNASAWNYLKDQGLPAKLVKVFETDGAERTFADEAAWTKHLDDMRIDNVKHRQTLTEAALLGSAIAHGVSPKLGVVSDGSAIYNLFVHGLCWIHEERNLAKLTPCGVEQCQAHESVLKAVWDLYADLKTYRDSPTPSQAESLRPRFDAIVNRVTCWDELNAALKRMGEKKDDLLRVLERPDMPLHTNTPERDFRDVTTKRKISAGTRSGLGKRCRDTFLSLKSTCKKVGVRFLSYLKDRVMKAGMVPQLSELVASKAASVATI